MALASKCASSCARLSVKNATDGQLKALADIGPEIEKRPLDFCPCDVGQAKSVFLTFYDCGLLFCRTLVVAAHFRTA